MKCVQLSNHTSKCPEKKKTCPLGQLQWNNELDGLLGDAHSLKQEWDGVLQECNEKEVNKLNCRSYTHTEA